MDRSLPLDHLRRTGLPPGRRAMARKDAERIAAVLREHGASRVVGIGSTFGADRRFTWRSDIDIVPMGVGNRDDAPDDSR